MTINAVGLILMSPLLWIVLGWLLAVTFKQEEEMTDMEAGASLIVSAVIILALFGLLIILGIIK